MLKLYHHGTSVCAVKVRLALAEKKLKWKGHYVDILKGEQFDPDFLKVNPKAVVPVLIHDNKVIRESTVICEYLEEVFQDIPIYPQTPYERALVRIWTKAVDEELHPACSAITYTVSHRHTILKNGSGSFDEFMAAGAAEGLISRARKWAWIQEGLDAPGVSDMVKLYDAYLAKMNEALQGKQWLVGDKISMADLALAPYLFRLSALSMEIMWKEGKYPNVEDWYDRISKRETFVKAVVNWVPKELGEEVRKNGIKSLPKIIEILESIH